jgi:ribosomal subunit interface protein
MNKTIEPVNFTANEEMMSQVGEIFDKLPRYNDRIVKADIYLKALTETPQNLKKVEVRVFLPGRDLFVEQEADTIVSASQQAFDRLKVLLTKEKEKLKSH